jgi:hypothetical protein
LEASAAGTISFWGAQVEPVTYQTTPGPYVATTASAYYGPRFDYDPVTLAPRGLLIEEARTNLALYSQQFDNASWIKANATVTANATTSPDGTTSADKVVEDTSNSTHFVRQPATVVTSTTYTYSVYLKASERGFAQVRYENSSSTQFFAANVNLSTGAVTTASFGSPTGTSASATNAGNGWWRVNLTVTASDTIFQAIVFSQVVSGTNSYIGDGTSGIYIWGAQLEAGAFATSYIPTVASTVSRSADVATMTGTNFSTWYNQAEGTFVAEISLNNAPAVATFSLYSVSDNTANERIFVGTGFGSGGNINALVTDGGVLQAQTINGGLASAGLYKYGNAYAANDFASVANGGSAVTDASGTLPTVDRLYIGASAVGTAPINGHIRAIAYYNTRLPNTQLQTLTAPSLASPLALDFISPTYTVGY